MKTENKHSILIPPEGFRTVGHIVLNSNIRCAEFQVLTAVSMKVTAF
jgi:hypothetical protein